MFTLMFKLKLMFMFILMIRLKTFIKGYKQHQEITDGNWRGTPEARLEGEPRTTWVPNNPHWQE